MIQLTEYAEATPSAQDMIEMYMDGIIKCAKSIRRNLPLCWGIDVDDLVNAGAMNILKYGERYDESKGVTLRTHVISCAKHGMLEELRQSDYVKRNVRNTVKTYTLQYQRLMAGSDHTPTIAEFADAHGITEEEAHAKNVLTESTERESGDLQKQFEHYSFRQQRSDCESDLIDDPFEEHIRTLPELQQAVLRMRYKEDREWGDIAKTLNIPKDSTYHHRRKAFAVLRPRLQED